MSNGEFAKYRSMFTRYENALNRQRRANSRFVKLADKVDDIRTRGVMTDDILVQAGNLVKRKRNADIVSIEASREAEAIRAIFVD